MSSSLYKTVLEKRSWQSLGPKGTEKTKPVVAEGIALNWPSNRIHEIQE